LKHDEMPGYNPFASAQSIIPIEHEGEEPFSNRFYPIFSLLISQKYVHCKMDA